MMDRTKKAVKEEIVGFFNNILVRDEKSRNFEKEIAGFAYSHSSVEGIQAFKELMQEMATINVILYILICKNFMSMNH